MSRPESYRPVLVSAGLHISAERTPRKVALSMGDSALTYGELGARVRRVTGLVARLGLRHGDRAVILAPNCLEYPELVCGLSDLGAIAATVNPRANASELAAACDDCRARLVFAHPSVADTAYAARAATVERVIVLGAEYEALLAASAEAGPSADVEETDPFALVYTSGTTGRPKGILIPHRSRVLTFHGMAMEYGVYGPDDRQLAIAPLAHGAGFAFAMATLFFGGTMEILSKFDPALVVEKLVREAYTGVFMVPTHYQAIFALPLPVLERHRGQARALRAIISNAAALPQPVKEQIIGYWGEGLLHETYGSTEAGVVTNLRPADQLRKPSCVGLPFALTRVRLLDDHGAEVPRGEVGELFSSSPYLFNGYFDKPEETAACTRDGWVSAGDLARRDEDGYLYIVDRKKDMVVSGGVNIYPREIEDVLATHPAVLESAVVGVPDAQWGERLRAFVVLRPGAAASEAEMLAHCRATLSGYKVPKDVRFIDAVPRNAGGKVLKKDLRALA